MVSLKTILACFSEAQVGLIHREKKGKKSRTILPYRTANPCSIVRHLCNFQTSTISNNNLLSLKEIYSKLLKKLKDSLFDEEAEGFPIRRGRWRIPCSKRKLKGFPIRRGSWRIPCSKRKLKGFTIRRGSWRIPCSTLFWRHSTQTLIRN